MRVLCAHRRGPYGVTGWTAQHRALARRVDRRLRRRRPVVRSAGRCSSPANDYALRLYNGDTGVIVRSAAARRRRRLPARRLDVEISPRRIAAVDTVHAMTIHKSQGSQFDAVAVVLPEPTSPILTRELLYTAVTRARRHLIVLGTEESVAASTARPIARATGLRERLWVE